MSDPLPPLPPTIEYYRPSEVYLPRPQKRRYWLHILLFLTTIFTTLVVGARMEFNFQNNQPAFSMNDDALPFFPARWALAEPSRLLLGLPFASTLMLILLAHEMGHYLYCRYYGVYATLPFFIPAPTLIGTLGAFLPGGQLDGGHIVFALAPRAHKIVSRVTILALIPLAIYFWAGWIIWAILLRISGMRHPVVPEWPGVTGGRRWLALFGLVMLVLTLTPAPFAHSSLLDVVREMRSGQ